jgi:Spy/CpxP family protein refolding chaperone
MRKQFSLLLTVLTAALLAAALPRPALAAQDAGAAPAPSQSQPQTQAQPQAEGPGEEAPDLDDQKLNLSPEQRKQLQQIREDGRAQVQGVRNDSSLTTAQKKHRIRQIRRTMHRQVMSALSPHQRRIWRARERERREQRRRHRRYRRQPA